MVVLSSDRLRFAYIHRRSTMYLEYRLTFNDYLEANQAHVKSQRFSYFFLWVGSIFLMVRGFDCILSGNIWIFFFFVILGIFANPSFNPLQRYYLARTWESQPSIRKPITIEITKEGITLYSPYFKSNLKWKIYIRFIETKNLFMIYQSNRFFNLFPKRAFSSDEQVNEFRDLLRTMIVKNSFI